MTASRYSHVSVATGAFGKFRVPHRRVLHYVQDDQKLQNYGLQDRKNMKNEQQNIDDLRNMNYLTTGYTTM